MAVTKTTLNDGINNWGRITYPSADVFLKERNYIILEGLSDTYLIKTIRIGYKTLNFGTYDLYNSSAIYIEASAYYKRNRGKFDIVITFYSDYENEHEQTATIPVNATTYDCYDPFKEITGSICRETGMAIITPPNRMIWNGKQQIKSLFATKRAAGTSSESYRWRINGTDDWSTLIRKNINIGTSNFFAEYIRKTISSNTDIVLSSINRSAEVRDSERDVVYVTWRTRWGLDVSHVFYLDTYATDKYDAQEVESKYIYEEYSKHVIKGSFYLDNIREPYDLWYYQTLANSELVVLTFDRWDTLPDTYMPNGTNALNGVKITGSNIKDAVVDGVAQSTITFDFELR